MDGCWKAAEMAPGLARFLLPSLPRSLPWSRDESEGSARIGAGRMQFCRVVLIIMRKMLLSLKDLRRGG
jgi:hypothetical protein